MDHKHRLSNINSQLRSYMDGTTARSLRDKGCTNKVVWGVSVHHLREIAQEYSPDYTLATHLWQMDVRECKLLATMLMDVKMMDIHTANDWIAQIDNYELAEMFVFNLAQYLPFADSLAHQSVTSHDAVRLLVGYHLYSRLFVNGFLPSEEETNFFLFRATQDLHDENISIRRAAMNAIIHFSHLSSECMDRSLEETNRAGFDFP